MYHLLLNIKMTVWKPVVVQAILYTGWQGPWAIRTVLWKMPCRGREIESGRVNLGSGEEGAIENLHMFPSDLFGIVCSCQFSSVTQLCPTLCDPMDCSTPGLPVQHQLLEFTEFHVHWVSDAIQPSHPLSAPCPPAFNLSQGLFQWVRSSHQVAKVLEFQLQYQSFHWIFRPDFL